MGMCTDRRDEEKRDEKRRDEKEKLKLTFKVIVWTVDVT